MKAPKYPVQNTMKNHLNFVQLNGHVWCQKGKLQFHFINSILSWIFFESQNKIPWSPWLHLVLVMQPIFSLCWMETTLYLPSKVSFLLHFHYNFPWIFTIASSKGKFQYIVKTCWAIKLYKQVCFGSGWMFFLQIQFPFDCLLWDSLN